MNNVIDYIKKANMNEVIIPTFCLKIILKNFRTKKVKFAPEKCISLDKLILNSKILHN